MARPTPARSLLVFLGVAIIVMVSWSALAPAPARRLQVADATFAQPIALVSLTAGQRYTCGLTNIGRAYCWGASWFGQLGAGAIDGRCDESIYAKGPCTRAPVEVYGKPRFTTLHAADHHACGIDQWGGGWCWGQANFGQLGQSVSLEQCTREGSREGEESIVSCRSFPIHVPVPAPTKLRSIDGTETMTCAVDTNGGAWCWGYGRDVEIRRVPLDRPLLSVAAGGTRACGLTVDHGIRCWQQYEVYDDGPTTPTARTDWVALDVGTAHACALDAQGEVSCWGSDKDGALGVGRTARGVGDEEPLAPVLGDHRFRSIATGARTSCAIDVKDALWCWGRVRESAVRANDRCLDSNWIGDGNDCTSRPVPVHPVLRFATVAVGASHACGITTAGALLCWGHNEAGQLGDGTLRSSDTPVAVRTRGITPDEEALLDARIATTSFLAHGGLALLAALVLLLLAHRRIAAWGAPQVIATWLGALVLYTLAVAAGSVAMGARADGPTRVLCLQLLVFAGVLTLYRVAVRVQAWWREGAARALAASAVASGVATMDDDETRPRARRALVMVLAGWALLGMTMLSMAGEHHYDDVSGGLAMLSLFIVAGITAALSAIGGVMAAVRLRMHRDDLTARAVLVMAALTVAVAAVLATWMFWPRER